jgi:membrane associated rhomboid family serine protease
MLIIPIRTESVTRHTPTVNYLLIGVNFVCFFLFSEQFGGERIAAFTTRYLALHAHAPSFHEFFSYQFVHATPMHLLGNMLFLWVFGNSVNGKMGDVSYLLFYIAGGVFAGWGYALTESGVSRLVGASGAIAAVTTAYLALFPRSHVTVLVWVFFFIHFFEWPAMILILLKVIVWDNIVGPALMGSGNVAHSAHLAGYLFGFLGALFMLFVRALPRDQFDILALWRRWRQRRAFASAMADPVAVARAKYGSVARVPSANAKIESVNEEHLDVLVDRRTRAIELLDHGKAEEAAAEYDKLCELDPRQCLTERHQLALGREYCRVGRFDRAAHTFERFLDSYPRSNDTRDVRLLLGIIYARDLRQYEEADKHLSQSLDELRDDRRREQCLGWLRDVRAALGRPAPQDRDSAPDDNE